MFGETVQCLTMSPLDPDVLYYGTDGTIFKTTDAGAHWQQAYTRVLPDGRFHTTGLEVTGPRNIVVHSNDPQRIYFCYRDIGLLISGAAGRSFLV